MRRWSFPLLFCLFFSLPAWAQPYTYYIAATAADGGISGSVGDDTRTLAQARLPATPWATISRWKSQVFDAGLMLPGDTVVISGLIREPNGVVLNAISYPWGSRYMKGFRQWLPSDGFPGTPGTQTLAANNIQRARLTSAQIIVSGAGAVTDTAGVGTIDISGMGIASGQIQYLTWRYYDNVDILGRHYGHRNYTTSAVSAGSGNFRFDGTTLSMDLSGAGTVKNDWEICKQIGAILQFQNWQGFGPFGPALVDGITFDRAVNVVDGAYLISMENCYQTGIRNITGYDGGHHNFGITGYSNDGCWMRNVVAMGQNGKDNPSITDNGSQGANSMTGSGQTTQTGWTWNATTQVLSKVGGYASGQQPLIPGALVYITAGSGTTPGQTVEVDYSINATSFRVRTPITATDGAINIDFEVFNISRNNSVKDFDYYIYPPLNLTLTNGVAGAARLTRGIGLSNAAPAATNESVNCIYTNNRYENGRVTWFPATAPSTGNISTIAAGGRRSGWTTNVEDPNAYPLLIQDVEFQNCFRIDSGDFQDVAINRCSFHFAPSTRSNDGSNSGQFVLQPSTSGAGVSASRFLLLGSEFIFDFSGGSSTASSAFSAPASGNNQTGWTLTAPSTLTKAGGLSNCPIPRPGTIISLTGGTGVTAAPYTVVSATATTIVVAETIVGTNGATDIAFDVCLAEVRARFCSFIMTGLRQGATTTIGRFCNTANFGVQGRYRGPFLDFDNCIIGFDRRVTGVTNILFINDQTYPATPAFGDRRLVSGNVYLNISPGEFSDISGGGFTTAVNFLNSSTGVDRFGQADNTNLIMNGPVSARPFPGAYPFLNPPPVASPFSLGGWNQRRSSNFPGAYQGGRPLADTAKPRGR